MAQEGPPCASGQPSVKKVHLIQVGFEVAFRGGVRVAVDCGLAVNPLSVESQFQAGVAFGLSQLMAKGAITLKNGIVEQRNFDGYVLPYMPDAPVAVDVHIMQSSDAPSGCGEPPVPVISPAVANARARLTGKRYRSLPLVTL